MITKLTINFLKKRFWLVSLLCVLTILSLVLVFFADEVMAKIYFANGYYTKVCGDNISPNGDLNGNIFRPSDACQNKCDLGAGTCSGNTVYRFECDGKTTDCRSNAQGPSSGQSLNRSGLCGKTVQIDVFQRNCLASGDCNSLPSYDANADLQDFIVWYSGDCSSSNPPSVQPSAPICNSDSVSLSVSPNNTNLGSQINFRISGDASTYINDHFGGGANNCSGNWAVGGSGLTCNAAAAGNFIWTHSWKHCEGSINNCSDTCTKTANFSVASALVPPAIPAVDLKANNSDGPITLNFNSSANLSWSSNNAVSCQASGDWSGSKGIFGSQSTQLNQVKTYIFTLACLDFTGTRTATDSVIVNVIPNLPAVVTKPAIVTF